MISIITPHRNDIEGINNLYNQLLVQSNSSFEWIIVDDDSIFENQEFLKSLKNKNKNLKLKVIFNSQNLGPSKSRNVGVGNSEGTHLIFLDSDDLITENFINNRDVECEECVVFKNFKTIDKDKNISEYSSINSDFLINFLSAKFAWQTTAILWDKNFFIKIGQFDENLLLLEDVELSIRVLMFSKKIKIILDNEVDFYYRVNPIDVKKRDFCKVANSVNLIIDKIYNKTKYILPKNEIKLLSNYYYLSVKYFFRTKEYDKLYLLKSSLSNFYRFKIIELNKYLTGVVILYFFNFRLININFFLRLNRILFKK